MTKQLLRFLFGALLFCSIAPTSLLAQTAVPTNDSDYVPPAYAPFDVRWEYDQVQTWMDEFTTYYWDSISDRSFEVAEILWNITFYPEDVAASMTIVDRQNVYIEYTQWADGMQMLLDTNAATGAVPTALIEHHMAKIQYARLVAYLAGLFLLDPDFNLIDSVIMREEYTLSMQTSIELAKDRCGDSVRAILERGY